MKEFVYRIKQKKKLFSLDSKITPLTARTTFY